MVSLFYIRRKRQVSINNFICFVSIKNQKKKTGVLLFDVVVVIVDDDGVVIIVVVDCGVGDCGRMISATTAFVDVETGIDDDDDDDKFVITVVVVDLMLTGANNVRTVCETLKALKRKDYIRCIRTKPSVTTHRLLIVPVSPNSSCFLIAHALQSQNIKPFRFT